MGFHGRGQMPLEFLHGTAAMLLCLMVDKPLAHIPGDSVQTIGGICSQGLKELLVGAFGIADVLDAASGLECSDVVIC